MAVTTSPTNPNARIDAAIGVNQTRLQECVAATPLRAVRVPNMEGESGKTKILRLQPEHLRICATGWRVERDQTPQAH